MAPYLEAAAATGRSQVAAIGCAQEFQRVWTARKRDTDPGACPQFSFTKAAAAGDGVTTSTCGTRTMGGGFIKLCTYFPYPVKVVGQRARVGQAAGGRGPGSGSPRCPTGSPPATTRLRCRRSATGFGPGTIAGVRSSGGWHRLPLPLTGADRDAGYWWELSMRQVEVSRTLVFDDAAPRPGVLRGADRATTWTWACPENVEMHLRPRHPPRHPGLPSGPRFDRPASTRYATAW